MGQVYQRGSIRRVKRAKGNDEPDRLGGGTHPPLFAARELPSHARGGSCAGRSVWAEQLKIPIPHVPCGILAKLQEVAYGPSAWIVGSRVGAGTCGPASSELGKLPPIYDGGGSEVYCAADEKMEVISPGRLSGARDRLLFQANHACQRITVGCLQFVQEVIEESVRFVVADVPGERKCHPVLPIPVPQPFKFVGSIPNHQTTAVAVVVLISFGGQCISPS